MLTIQEVRQALKKQNISTCARDTGIHYQQLWRIAAGNDTNPQYKTLEKICQWLEAQAHKDQ